MLYKDFDLTIESPRIRITPLTPSDTESYARLLYGDLYDTYIKLMGKAPEVDLNEDSCADVDLNTNAHTPQDEIHALRLHDDDAFIGWITLQQDDKGRPDIGVSLIPSQQNKGFGPDAVRLFVNRLHEDYGLEKVYLRIKEGNLQSQRAAEKLGAVKFDSVPDPTIMALLEELPNQNWHEPGKVYCYYLELPV